MTMSLYASKEDYERAHAPRWYCVDKDGVAMLCKDEADAREQAVENDECWPRRAPHSAVLLGDVASARRQALQDAARRVDEECGHALQEGWSVEAVQALMATRDLLKAHADIQATTVEVKA